MFTHNSKFDCILESLAEGENVFLHGPGGTGKTYTIARLVEYFSHGDGAPKNVSCTALTGVAAANMRTEIQAEVPVRTLHSWAGVGIANKPADKLYNKVVWNQRTRARWQNTELLFIDEISMLGRDLFEKLDYIARKIRNSPRKPFGGIQLVVSGDLLQLPPVDDAWVFTSPGWQDLDFVPYIFETSKRYDDSDYFALLLRARVGKLSEADCKSLCSRVEAYHALETEGSKPLAVIPTVLYAKNINTDVHNYEELEELETPEHIYTAVDVLDTKDPETLSKLLDRTIPRRLQLKVGAQVMLKANLKVAEGLVNGSRGVVTDLGVDWAKVKIFRGDEIYISPYCWSVDDTPKVSKSDAEALLEQKHNPVVTRECSRKQLPLILAWALTIHKSQASTLDYAICDVGPDIFMPGQAYVALSRVRNLKGLLLKNFTASSLFADEQAIAYDKRLKEEEPIEYVSDSD